MNSLLFLGAGFSVGAKSIGQDVMPAGNPLKVKLATLLGEDPNDYDLQTLAEEFTTDDGNRLFELLYNTFTASMLLDDQKAILDLPWRRIYTTNYDNIIEHHCPNIVSFDFDQPKPRSLPRQLVVHLHGSIRRAAPENVLSQVILKEDTYIQQIASPSPWLDEFARDARFSDACIFLGYSLADHHISARLSKSEPSAKKTYFFTSRLTSIFHNRTKDYGNSFEIDRLAFSDMCKTLPSPVPATNIRQLRNFRYIDPFADKKPQDIITPPEIFGLVTLGVFTLHRYASSYGTNTYIVERAEFLDTAQKAIDGGKTVLIHSRLGNGKSIFLTSLAYHLSEKGYKCFHWKGLSAGLDSEIALLARSGRVVICFDNYDSAAESIKRLGSELPDAKFVVTARSNQQAARYHEIKEDFPEPVTRVSVDYLSDNDASSLISLLDRAGLYSSQVGTTVKASKEFRDIVTLMFDNKAVASEISKLLDPMLSEPDARFVLVSTQLAKWVGASIDTDTLDKAGNVDSYSIFQKHKDASSDIFILEDERVASRSSVLAEYLIQKVFTAKDICGACYFLVRLAVTRKSERAFRSLMGGLMQVSNLKRLTRYHTGADGQINWLFNNLAKDMNVNDEPLFWLQYAILMMDEKKYAQAEHYLEASYVRASRSAGFETYQLDTQAVRIYLEVEASLDRGNPVDRMEKIIDSLEKLLPMIGNETHRFFAVDVLNKVQPFIEKRSGDLSVSERNSLVYYLNLLSHALKSLNDSTRAQTGSDLVRARLERSIGIITL